MFEQIIGFVINEHLKQESKPALNGAKSTTVIKLCWQEILECAWFNFQLQFERDRLVYLCCTFYSFVISKYRATFFVLYFAILARRYVNKFSRDFNDRQIGKRALIFAIRTSSTSFYFSNNLNFLKLLDRLEQEKRTFKDSILTFIFSNIMGDEFSYSLILARNFSVNF